MIGYSELYELLRKEKYADALQELPKKFVADFSEYLGNMKSIEISGDDLMGASVSKDKKQFENAISLFKELMLRRKKKLLNLVFVATETGIMKKDYENMLVHEKEIFDVLVKVFEEGDKKLNMTLNGRKEIEDKKRMIMFNQSVEEFVGGEGESVGPYSSGELVNVDFKVAEILVGGGKASYVDEN